MKAKNSVLLVRIRAKSSMRLAKILTELPENDTAMITAGNDLNVEFERLIKTLDVAANESVESILAKFNKEAASKGLAYDKCCKPLIHNLKKHDKGVIDIAHIALTAELQKQKYLTDSEDFSTRKLQGLMNDWENAIQTCVKIGVVG